MLERTYWGVTGLLAFAMLIAGVQEFRHAPEILEGAQRLGYPPYVLTMLGVAKLVGAPLLLVKGLPHLKEWVYAGFAFDFGGAVVSHTVSGDTLDQTLPAIICAGLLALSYYTHRARSAQAPDAIAA